MKQGTSKTHSQNNGLTVLIASSILITTFLIFIDKGYYIFEWMTSIENWIVFLVYAVAILAGQLLFLKLLLKKYQGLDKTLLSVLGGATIGILFVIGVVFTNW